MKNNNKTKKLMAYGLILVAVVLVVFGLYMLLKPTEPKNETKKPEPNKEETVKLDETQEKAVKMTKDFHSYLLDSSKTREDFETLTGISKNYFLPLLGKDSAIQITYPEEFKGQIKENLNSYEKLQEQYLKKIAKYLKNNYSYKLIDVPLYTVDEKQIMQQTEVTPFSYELLRKDLESITTKLLAMANAPELEEKPEPLLYYYKARIVALKIISDNLDEYKSKQKFKQNIIFNISEDKTLTCQNCDTYINYCRGFYIDTVVYKDGIDYYAKNYEARINKMIDSAVKKGTITEKNPIKIKED